MNFRKDLPHIEKGECKSTIQFCNHARQFCSITCLRVCILFVHQCVCMLLIHTGEKPSYLQSMGNLSNGKVICFPNRVKAKREYCCSAGNNISACLSNHIHKETGSLIEVKTPFDSTVWMQCSYILKFSFFAAISNQLLNINYNRKKMCAKSQKPMLLTKVLLLFTHSLRKLYKKRGEKQRTNCELQIMSISKHLFQITVDSIDFSVGEKSIHKFPLRTGLTKEKDKLKSDGTRDRKQIQEFKTNEG